MTLIISSSIIFADITKKLNHLESLQKKFPYGLIGDDFGILNEDDLAINTCEASPEPFSTESDAYPYWQCFEAKSAIMSCEDEGYDTDEKSEMAVLGIDIHTAKEDNFYIARRAIHMKTCKLYVEDWKRLTKSEKYFCASGQYWNTEKTVSGKTEKAWSFDKYKTKRGCDSYFKGACSLRYQLKNGCKIVKST